jgi:tetratricopeptide (TPR) repeat protein
MSSPPSPKNLEDISGLDKANADALIAVGITDILSLAKAEASTLLEALGAESVDISAAQLEEWIKEAKLLAAPSTPLKQSDLYRQALHAYQQGQWAQSLALTEQLDEIYPFSPDVKRFKADVQLHIEIEQSNPELGKASQSQRILRIGALVLLAVIVVVALFFGSVSGFNNFLTGQQSEQRAVQTQQVLDELAVLESNAAAFLNNSRPDDALALIEEMQTLNPNYPGIDALLARAVNQLELDVLFENAMLFIEQGKYELALENFENIAARDSRFRDINRQIDSLQVLMGLDTVIEAADLAFEEGDWAGAIEGYQQVVEANFADSLDLSALENKLYLSYLSEISATLNQEVLTIEQIDQAEAYYQSALALKPQDAQTVQERAALRNAFNQLTAERYLLRAEATLQQNVNSREAINSANFFVQQAEGLNPSSTSTLARIDLLNNYIDAYSSFSSGDYASAVPSLEVIYRQGGSLSTELLTFMLYEAYIAQGNDEIARGHYAEALGNFQLASAVADKFPEARVRKLYAEIKSADTLGKLGEYELAATQFQKLVGDYQLDQRRDNPDAPLELLVFAEQAIERGDMRFAFLYFSEAFLQLHDLLPVERVFVNSGSGLVNIALEQGTSIDLLINANQLPNVGTIGSDKEILIPYVSNE